MITETIVEARTVVGRIVGVKIGVNTGEATIEEDKVTTITKETVIIETTKTKKELMIIVEESKTQKRNQRMSVIIDDLL